MSTGNHADLLRCPKCRVALVQGAGPSADTGLACPACGLRPSVRGTILDFLVTVTREAQAAEVEAFYERRPFPGYMPGDDAASLIDRARKSAFLRALDAAVPADARVIDCGCGTGQLAAFLALSGPRRTVFGADGCRASLELADGFKKKAGIENLNLVRADLFELPVAERAFEVVISRGVVHHTPDPDLAIARVGSLVAPGGVFVLGFYETAARALHVARRQLFKVAEKPVWWLDPILRRRDLDREKKLTWIADQYLHPLERILPLPDVLATVEKLGFEWTRTVPPAVSEGNGAEDGSMFEATPRPSAFGLARLRGGWMAHGLGDEDAGLVCLVVRDGSKTRAPMVSRA